MSKELKTSDGKERRLKALAIATDADPDKISLNKNKPSPHSRGLLVPYKFVDRELEKKIQEGRKEDKIKKYLEFNRNRNRNRP